MPDRLRSRVALMALLILVIIAGIRAVGPAVGWYLPARSVVVAVGCALEAVLAGLLVALRWRRPAAAGPGDLGARLRPLLSGVLVTGLIAIPLAILVGSIGKFRRRRPIPPALKPLRLGRTRGQSVRFARGTVSLAIVQDLLIAILLVAVIAAAILLWRQRRSRVPRLHLDVDDTRESPTELARALDSGRLALRELDDARAAIIRCYLAMEASLADAGAARGVAETPDELLRRAVAGGLVDQAPAGRLTGLFYEARFSTHPMPRSRRDQAERALAELMAALPADGTVTGAPVTSEADGTMTGAPVTSEADR